MENIEPMVWPEAELVIRGLDARKAWSRAEHSTDPRERFDAECTAIDTAYEQGDQDFWNGRAATDIPLLLADVPDLARHWEYGWQLGQASKVGPWQVEAEDGRGEEF